jgi:hypothetical protein
VRPLFCVTVALPALVPAPAAPPAPARLCDAIPPRWLTDANPLRVAKAPSAFGPVSLRLDSALQAGEEVAAVEAPPRAPAKWTLRLPDPPGYVITGAKVGNEELKRDVEGRVDLTGRTGKFHVIFTVKPKK